MCDYKAPFLNWNAASPPTKETKAISICKVCKERSLPLQREKARVYREIQPGLQASQLNPRFRVHLQGATLPCRLTQPPASLLSGPHAVLAERSPRPLRSPDGDGSHKHGLVGRSPPRVERVVRTQSPSPGGDLTPLHHPLHPLRTCLISVSGKARFPPRGQFWM